MMGLHWITCSKCNCTVLSSDRGPDGEPTGRLWVNLRDVQLFTEPPPMRPVEYRNDYPPMPARYLANVPWPGDPDAPIHTMNGRCPRCHGRFRMDAPELWLWHDEAVSGSLLRNTNPLPDSRAGHGPPDEPVIESDDSYLEGIVRRRLNGRALRARFLAKE
jgi:hypothetical protein